MAYEEQWQYWMTGLRVNPSIFIWTKFHWWVEYASDHCLVVCEKSVWCCFLIVWLFLFVCLYFLAQKALISELLHRQLAGLFSSAVSAKSAHGWAGACEQVGYKWKITEAAWLLCRCWRQGQVTGTCGVRERLLKDGCQNQSSEQRLV